MAEYLKCDRCGAKYDDVEGLEMAKRMQEEWEASRKAKGIQVRGIAPCPVVLCRGELVLKDSALSGKGK